MAFNRNIFPSIRPTPTQLNSYMAGIGMNFACEPNNKANIEDTLIHAAELGMDGGDLRVLSVLTTWFGVHHTHINADRLVRIIASHTSIRVQAYGAAVATWLAKDRRFARLASNYAGPIIDVLPVGTDFQIARRGADERFKDSVLRVPSGTLRDRPSDVAAPETLVQLHPGYRNRVLMGPSWRADVWTELEREPNLSVAEVARRAYCSFSTAWQIAQDFKLVRSSEQSLNVA